MAAKLKGALKPATVAADEELTLGIRKDRERDETQQSIDKDMQTCKKDWESAGKPTYEQLTAVVVDDTHPDGRPSDEFINATKAGYMVDTDDRQAVKSMIRRAGTLTKGVPVYAADVVDSDAGTVRILFCYSPPPVKADAAAQDGASGDESNTDTETPGAGAASPDAPTGTPDQTPGEGTPNPDAGTDESGERRGFRGRR